MNINKLSNFFRKNYDAFYRMSRHKISSKKNQRSLLVPRDLESLSALCFLSYDQNHSQSQTRFACISQFLILSPYMPIFETPTSS